MVSKWQNWPIDAFLVQISVVCFVVAIISVGDLAAYKERLDIVTSAGKAFFGWDGLKTKKQTADGPITPGDSS
jgi:hypothetical protein